MLRPISFGSMPDRAPLHERHGLVDSIAIFNSSFKMGIFHDVWKIARVTSIFKSGSKNDFENYRPLAVVSAFSRLLEK